MAFLIDKYLPEFTFKEHHERFVNAASKDCFYTTKALDMSKSFITKTLIKLRGLPVTDLKMEGFLKNLCFKYIEDDPYKEFVIDASQPGLKIFWNFHFKTIEENKTLVST